MLALWLTYGASATVAVWLARRCVAALPGKIGLLLFALPLLFTGKALWTGGLYGPADLYYGHDPWKRIAPAQGIEGVGNPILSDVAFQGFPWRAAVFDAARQGRWPLWNRFLLAGNPLLGSAQAGVFHPSTWLSLLLPMPLSVTFSATFTIFLSLLTAFLFFHDFGISARAATVGAIGWGFSTILLFWNGYAEGLTLSTLPLLLTALRRLARDRDLRAAGLTAGALVLCLAGGQPEMFFFGVVTGTVVFFWELARQREREAARTFSLALLAGALALLLSAPALLPVVEAIRHSSEFRARSQAPSRQSVSAPEAARRLLPAVLPFSHGIYGKSPVQAERHDGSGMPFAYAGSLLFPLAALCFTRRVPGEAGRGLFLGFCLAGLLLGASAPGLMDLFTHLPGFALAHNYRLVFWTSLGLSGLAALGTAQVERSPRTLLPAAALTAALLAAGFLLSRGILRERELPERFVRNAFTLELAPVVLLAFAAAGGNGRRGAALCALLLVAQRAAEMHGTYPTLPARSLAPSLPTLSALPRGKTAQPYRVVAAGDVFRPNASALYGLQDVRGYESIALDRFVDTYPLWCRPQWASFNRVDGLDAPFLSFLNVRFAIASPEASTPAGWVERARGAEMALFENPRALPRAFVPRRVGFAGSPAALLSAIKETADFGEICWLSGVGPATSNGQATLAVREDGPDLLLEVNVAARALVATSIPDWPGWRVEVDEKETPTVAVNHAFVGFWLSEGQHAVSLVYRPVSFRMGVLALGAGIVAAGLMLLAGRRQRPISAGSPGP